MSVPELLRLGLPVIKSADHDTMKLKVPHVCILAKESRNILPERPKWSKRRSEESTTPGLLGSVAAVLSLLGFVSCNIRGSFGIFS